MKTLDVVCLGLAVVNFPVFPVDESIFTRDVTPVEPISLLPGGDAANQSIVMSRLGLKTALVTRRGDDMFGSIMLELLREYGDGIDLSGITVDEDAATGVCAMMIRPDGQRVFCSHKGSVLKLSSGHVRVEMLKSARTVSYAGMCSLSVMDAGVPDLFKTARENGLLTIADTKYAAGRMNLETVAPILKHTDYFFPSYMEASEISGETDPVKIARVFLKAGARNVGIKLGEDGCYFSDGKADFSLPSAKTDVVDTTGAGDNFMSGFTAGLLQGWDARDCCRFGTASAALCVAKLGPVGAVQSFDQVKVFMDKSIN